MDAGIDLKIISLSYCCIKMASDKQITERTWARPAPALTETRIFVRDLLPISCPEGTELTESIDGCIDFGYRTCLDHMGLIVRPLVVRTSCYSKW